MDDIRYLEAQAQDEAAYEALCKRCGICCGAGSSDPCSNLRGEGSGKYYCVSYRSRIGTQHTVSGRSFACVPIRSVLQYAPPTPDCGYA